MPPDERTWTAKTFITGEPPVKLWTSFEEEITARKQEDWSNNEMHYPGPAHYPGDQHSSTKSSTNV